MPPIERMSSREVYRNSWMTVREDAIRRPDGSHGIYGVIDKPTYALVVARDGDLFHLVEQFRYPIRLRRWEVPQEHCTGAGRSGTRRAGGPRTPRGDGPAGGLVGPAPGSSTSHPG